MTTDAKIPSALRANPDGEPVAAGGATGFPDGRLAATAQRAAQPQPVETRQNACHRIAKWGKKSRREAGTVREGLLVPRPGFHPGAGRSTAGVGA